MQARGIRAEQVFPGNAGRWHAVAARVGLYYGWRILVGLLKRLERRFVSGFTREIPRRRCATRRKKKAYQKNYADYRSVYVLSC
jgi:hypothetical protein